MTTLMVYAAAIAAAVSMLPTAANLPEPQASTSAQQHHEIKLTVEEVSVQDSEGEPLPECFYDGGCASERVEDRYGDRLPDCFYDRGGCGERPYYVIPEGPPARPEWYKPEFERGTDPRWR